MQPADGGPVRRGRMSAIISSAGTIVLAGLVPKCPLCIVAMLSAWGVGAATAGLLAPAVRPVLVAVAAIAIAALVAVEMRRAWRRTRGSASGHCCSA